MDFTEEEFKLLSSMRVKASKATETKKDLVQPYYTDRKGNLRENKEFKRLYGEKAFKGFASTEHIGEVVDGQVREAEEEANFKGSTNIYSFRK